MKETILVISATEAECAPFLRSLVECKAISQNLYSGRWEERQFDVLVTGIGNVATCFHLAQTLMQRSYSSAISIGIAGSFTETITIGETVQITEDCFADLGVDNNGQFRSLKEEGLQGDDFLGNPFPLPTKHREVRGITVQTASGSQKRIDELIEKFHPQIETMENAAFFYVCRMMNIPFASFRGISNKVEPRNRKNWRITEAIENVNEALRNLIGIF